MEKRTHLNACATAAAFLLIGSFTVAQSASRGSTLKPREGSSGQASGLARTLKPSERRAPEVQKRKDGAISHADFPRSADRTKSGDTGGIDGGSNAAAHAAARSNAPSDAPNDIPTKSSSNARTGENPLYENSGNSGTNPLHESKDQLKANAGASNSQSAPKTSADASRKHLAGVKYQNRTAAGQRSNKQSSTETFRQDFGQVQATKR